MVLQGLSRRKTEFEGGGLGWINGGSKDQDFGWGRHEIVVNSCFEDVDGGVGLKRVWEFVPEAGKKRNERVKVSSAS